MVPAINRRVILVLLAVSILLIPLRSAVAQDSEKKPVIRNQLVFGFLPLVSTDRLIKRFEPLADYVAGEMGVPVRFETAPNFAEFYNRTVTGRNYDLLYTAPHFYFLANRDAGYRVVARVGLPSMKAVISARKDGKVKTLKDLCGRKLSTPDRLAVATLMIKQHVANAKCPPGAKVALVETPTHNASLLAAHKKVTDAAGLMAPPYKRSKPEIKNDMIIISETPTIPHIPLSVAPWVTPETAGKFQEILLNMNKTEKGKALLKHLRWPGFAAAGHKDYEILESYSLLMETQ